MAVPWTVSVVSFVIRSPGVPLSSVNPAIDGAAGGDVSMVTCRAAETGLALPARSLAEAVKQFVEEGGQPARLARYADNCATLVDGTCAPRYRADIGVRGDRIAVGSDIGSRCVHLCWRTGHRFSISATDS